MSGHAKVLREQVSRKNVGGGEILDRLPVIAPGSRDRLRLVLPEKNIERAKTALDIRASDDDVPAVLFHNRSRIAQEFCKQFRVKPIPRDPQVLELMRFDQSPRAVMFKH